MEQVREDHSASTLSRNSLLYNLILSLALKENKVFCVLLRGKTTLNQSFCICFKYQREGKIPDAQRASDKHLASANPPKKTSSSPVLKPHSPLPPLFALSNIKNKS